MKLLIITYSYTPDLTPRAFRWSAVAERLAQKGHTVHVLCAAGSSSHDGRSEDGVAVHRVKDWLLNASSRVTPGAGAVAIAPRSAVGGLLYATLRKLVRAVWRAVYWPDYACGWVIPAARTARSLCETNNYDWIISVSHPFSGHVVGMLAKAQTPQSKWFVDISDPYCLMREPSPNNRLFYAWISRAIEGRVIAGADAISVTTESTHRLYESEFPASIGKMHVIPPLLSISGLDRPSTRQVDGVIRLVFVGTLYRRLRSPKHLLACVSALKTMLPQLRLELHFYGAVNDCGDDLASCPEVIRSCLFVHGMVCRENVVQAMIDADVLVNIGNDSESQLASKVIEYMAVGKPILNLVSIARDVSIGALADYPSTLTILRSGSEPDLEVIKALRDFVLNPCRVDHRVTDLVRSQFSEDRIAGIYGSILEHPISVPS
jgi:glycosyltransferase involved in cell wall biosynthesis